MTTARSSVGIIGMTGRMGRLLADTVNANHPYQVRYGFRRGQSEKIQYSDSDYTLLPSLSELFAKSDYVVDFSNASLIDEMLEAALTTAKPLVICTTGWQREGATQARIEQLCQQVPVVIAPNTSLGACLQRYMAAKMAQALPRDYDIDIHEKHHRHKIDIPSGTSVALAQAIVDAQLQQHQVSYQVGTFPSGPRPDCYIGMSAQRSGQLPGEHDVSFTSAEEMLTLKHVAFDRQLFAKGGVVILDWLRGQCPPPGSYTMFDVLGLT